RVSRRGFISTVVAAGAATSTGANASRLQAQPSGGIRGFDHVALPMQNTEAMLAVYRGLGLTINETPQTCSASIAPPITLSPLHPAPGLPFSPDGAVGGRGRSRWGLPPPNRPVATSVLSSRAPLNR